MGNLSITFKKINTLQNKFLTYRLRWGTLKLTALSALISGWVLAGVMPSFAADIEIYVPGTTAQGSTTIMFTLDISGSMDKRSISLDYGAICSGREPTTDSVGAYCTASGYEITAQIRKDCDAYGTTYRCYDRITRLKQGMNTVLRGDDTQGIKRLADDLIIGMSTLGTYTNTYHNSGRIIVPARRLGDVVSGTRTQRDILLDAVAGLAAQTNTPTSRSYAEVVAYFMGQTTLGGTYCSGSYRWYECYRTQSTNDFSGFPYSVSNSKNPAGTLYSAPSSITRQLALSNDDKRCNGQGIYVLTDGEPNYGQGSLGLIKQALGSYGNGFTCTDGDDGWDCTLKLADTILDPLKNPAQISIKTAVVGFGSDFNSIPSSVTTETAVAALPDSISSDVKLAARWGIRGQGGWYSGSNAADVASSIESFVSKAGGTIPSVSTGSSTIPMDALNPEVVQGYSYFPQFEPKVGSSHLQQLWFGNLKKYYVVNNSVYASAAAGADNAVNKDGLVRDVSDIWAKSDINYATETPIYEKGGALSRLILGTVTQANGQSATGRKLLTDYEYDATQAQSEKQGRNFDLVEIKYSYPMDSKTKSDSVYTKPLMSVLGYQINDTQTEGLDLSQRTATVRQMGSILHSSPILLTQEGKLVAKYKKNASGQETNVVYVDSESRQDYVLFGSTQGMLHVVDAESGLEKFTFLPKEMLMKQSETLLQKGGNLSKGSHALYYGIDGEWTAHTVYVTKEDGTQTVKGAVRNVIGSTTDKENLQGKQWVYGGMRMGGRSYYALDVTDIDSPKIKFHIDPETSRVYSKAHPRGIQYHAIAKMGQSWSKPRIDYVNWKGQRKLVMFVGGGYDAGGENGDGLFDSSGVRTGYAGYENFNYKQENSAYAKQNIGSGVYMFDADSGELLWYADATQSTADAGVAHLSHTDLKYSTVAEIKTVDRDNDGTVDHLYFGDLAGQAFRVDLKNDGSQTTYTTQVSKILNLHQSNGTSPRFYLAPVFTSHRDGDGNIVMASFISGNKSSPLLATLESTSKKNSDGLSYDAVYAIYDYDITATASAYPSLSNATPARTLSSNQQASKSKLRLISYGQSVNGNAGINKGAEIGLWGGWYYRLDHKLQALSATQDPGVVKGLVPLIAMEGNLYVTMFDASATGTSSTCGAGVKGESFTERLCLPTGLCNEDAMYSYNLGAGIVTPGVGPDGNCADGSCRSLVVPVANSETAHKVCKGNDCSGDDFIKAGGSIRFISNRWYERYAKGN